MGYGSVLERGRKNKLCTLAIYGRWVGWGVFDFYEFLPFFLNHEHCPLIEMSQSEFRNMLLESIERE